MSHKRVRCECGCEFVVPAGRRATVNCPECGAYVLTDPDDAPPPKPFLPPEAAAVVILPHPGQAKPWWPLWLMAAGGLATAGLLVWMCWYFVGRHDRGPVPAPPAPPAVAPPPPAEPVAAAEPVPEKPAPPPAEAAPPPVASPPPPPPDPVETLARINRLVSRNNMAGVVSVILLHTGMKKEYDDLKAVLIAGDRDIDNLAVILVGRAQSLSVLPHYRFGDEIRGFGPFEFDPRNPLRFAGELKEWLKTFQPGSMALAFVRRGVQDVTVPMYFMERSEEIIALASRAVVPLGGAPDPAQPPPVVAIPHDLLSEARKRLAALHPHYRKAIPPEDEARSQQLLSSGRGTVDDMEYLQRRLIGDFCRRAEEDRAGIEARRAELEARLQDAAAVDTLHLKDGRRLQGRVEDETEDALRLRSRFGSVRFSKTDVARIERGDAAAAEFRQRYEAARGKADALLPLLAWCREKKLEAPRELVATAILAIDPGHEAAGRELGMGREGPRPVAGPGAAPEGDLLRLKDGAVRSGLIVSESESAVTMEVLVRGSKGETIGTGQIAIPRSEILKVEKISDEARQKIRDRARAFEDRRRRHSEALGRLRLEPATLLGGPALRVPCSRFDLVSTCPEEVAREAAHNLNEAFEAYQRYFAVRRNRDRRIQVLLFANREEYQRFQGGLGGGLILNPAYYHLRDNYIAAYNVVQSAEAETARQEILRAQGIIQDWKKRLASEEDRIERYARGVRQQILDLASGARSGLTVEQSQQQLAIDRWKEQQLEALRRGEQQAAGQVQALRRQASQAIAACERAILDNGNLLSLQARRMYETLFHEAFHAFAANYLWDDVDNRGIPRWLHEGMATYFEMSVVEAGELIHGAPHPVLLRLLRDAVAGPVFPAVPDILRAGADVYRVDHREEAARSTLHYACAWALVHLLSRRTTRETLEAYVAEVVGGRDPVESFEKLAGKKWPEVQAELRLHIEALR